jgi:serine protease Do
LRLRNPPRSDKLADVKPLATILTFIAVLAARPITVRAQQAPPGGDAATVAAFENTLVDVIARAETSIVAISRIGAVEPSVLQPQIEDVFGDLRVPSIRVDQSQTTGAGVIIDPAGLVLTQYLAVKPGDAHTVTTIHGRTYPAVIKAADPRSGLAILAITPPASSLQRTGTVASHPTALPQTFPALPLGDAAQLRKGQLVVVIGDPFAIRSDGEPTASWGSITNFARKAPSGTNLNNAAGPAGDYRTTFHHLGTLLQTDAKLGWSAGGGAVVNLRGELVGLTTTTSAIAGHEQPAGYAIPIDDTTRRIIDALKQGREVEYGLLGLSFRPPESPLGTADGGKLAGVMVQQVYPGSPAASAGLEQNDVITQVGDKEVRNIDGVQLAVSTLPPGKPIVVHFVRGGQPGTVTTQLAKLAVAGEKVVTAQPPMWRGMRVDFATALDTPTLTEKLTSGAIDPAGCVLVADVEPNSVAWHAGLRRGMFISQVGGRRVTTPDEFRAAVAGQTRGVTLQLTQPIRTPAHTEASSIEIP